MLVTQVLFGLNKDENISINLIVIYMLMDFNFLYNLNHKNIGKYFLTIVDEQRSITYKEEKESEGQIANKLNSNRISYHFNPNALLIKNNVLPTIRQLFMSNLQLSFNSLNNDQRITIRKKLQLFMSKFDDDDFELFENHVFDYGLLEIDRLLRKEFFLTLIDLKSFTVKINNSQENEPFENFLADSGFYHIDMVKCLTEDSKAVLIDELKNKCTTDIPGFLAMLHQLGFYKILYKKYNNKTKTYKVLADVLKRDSGTIKGHISSFDKKNLNARRKYTAFKKLDDIEDFYNDLKKGG